MPFMPFMTFMTFVSAWAFGRPGSRTRSSDDAKNESMDKDRVVKEAELQAV